MLGGVFDVVEVLLDDDVFVDVLFEEGGEIGVCWCEREDDVVV